MYDAVGFVKLRSYAIETSPAEVNEVGRFEVTAVSLTEKREEPASKILNNDPVVVPLVPIFKANKSPVAVVAEPGLQSRFNRDPIPTVPVRDVAVDLRSRRVPDVRVLAVPVENCASLPVVRVVPLRVYPVPVVSVVFCVISPLFDNVNFVVPLDEALKISFPDAPV